jgi:chemotaxis protein methyltransferase CheR
VLIYFNQNLQNKVQTLFYDSLINGGLALGSKESIQFTDYFAQYSELDSKATYFQKKILKCSTKQL